MPGIEVQGVSPEEIIHELQESLRLSKENKYAFQVGLKDVEFDVDQEKIAGSGIAFPFANIQLAEQAIRLGLIHPTILYECDDTTHHVIAFDPRPVGYSGFMDCVTHSLAMTDLGLFEVGRYPAVNLASPGRYWQWFLHRQLANPEQVTTWQTEHTLTPEQVVERVFIPGNLTTTSDLPVWDMVNFSGQMYAATGWRDETPAAIWRTANGSDWTAVTTDGFGISSTPRSADVMTVYQGQIYAAVSSYSEISGVGAYIYRSSSGDPGSWSPVVTGGNGDIQNGLVDAFAEFNGALYACGKNTSQGAFIWKSSPDGSTWSQVGSYGLDASHQDEAITMTVFNGKLFVGIYNGNSEQTWPGLEFCRRHHLVASYSRWVWRRE